MFPIDSLSDRQRFSTFFWKRISASNECLTFLPPIPLLLTQHPAVIHTLVPFYFFPTNIPRLRISGSSRSGIKIIYRVSAQACVTYLVYNVSELARFSREKCAKGRKMEEISRVEEPVTSRHPLDILFPTCPIPYE